MTILRMFGLLLPILVFILAILYFVLQEYVTEGFESQEKIDMKKRLKQIEMKINSNVSQKDKERVDKLFKAFWKVSKESSQQLVVNPITMDSIPAWVKTNEDASLVLPYLGDYAMGRIKSIPQTKADAMVEGFKNMTDDTALAKIDDMEQDEIENTIRSRKMKPMQPKEAEAQAYDMLKNLANTDFNKDFYESIGYVISTLTHKAVPDAKLEDIRDSTIELTDKMPLIVGEVQMNARSLLRKVEAAKHKDVKIRKSKTLAQLRKTGTYSLDREGYLKSLPEHKRILMEEFTQENFIVGGILKKLMEPVIKFAMKIIQKVAMMAINLILKLLPMLIDSLFIPLVETLMEALIQILTNKKLIQTVVKFIKKMVDLTSKIGWELIKALSIPVVSLFFQIVVPMAMKVARFFVFLFRMAAKMAFTVYNFIKAAITKNWGYVVYIYEWALSSIKSILMMIYNFIEPYVSYLMYIIIPIGVMLFMWHLGPPVLTMINNTLAMSMTAIPERTFHPVKVAVENSR